MRITLFNLAASALVLGFSTVACSGPIFRGHPAASLGMARSDRAAEVAVGRARRALARQRFDLAVGWAERAVTFAPGSPAPRELLGRTYLAAGRFASAEAALRDARSLGGGRGKAAVALALAQIAQGHEADARTTLLEVQGVAPSDLGLAMALAGEKGEAVALLEAAIRAGGANARTRQNLGLAYALDGRWDKAMIAASMDLQGAALAQRMQDWSYLVRAQAPRTQVAAVLQIAPAAVDPGQPVGLALAPVPQAPRVAAADALVERRAH